ncbi:WD40 repeat domain-containing serine/threonine protein kinase [Streptomyces violascens]|uniref:WD40 repeat domain-containing serine/threonine protein kinase n=1 Tax=Streptomyces violascens TaxID=67381 RepID=UPI003648322B
MNAPTSSAVWSPDERVDGRYRVIGELGRGGMGVVHRVRHLGWGIDMAVKSSRPELLRGAGDRDLFVREAETWVSLGLHPNVCACYYVRVLDGVPRVFAEYVDGGSLAEWIGDGRLYGGGAPDALARVLDTAVQVARGLEHAHRRSLVHQDVKPANVLLDGAGAAKITDFGLARSKAAAATTRPDAAPGVTVLVPSGGMTVAYASPEQLAGQSVGRRSDVYSFAVSVLQMFTGGVYWSAGSVAGMALEEYLADPANPVPVPPEAGNLLRRCLRQDPAERPSSMADIADVLTGIYEQYTGFAYPRPAPQEADLRADELNNRGLSLLDLARTTDAGRAFDQALEADPHHVGAAYNGGLLRWRTGALTDVELIAQLEAIPQHPATSWQVRLHLARIHLERGDLEAARGLLHDLARERPEDGEVQTALRAAASGSVADARRVEYRELRGPDDLPGPPARLIVSHEVGGYRPIRFTPDGRLALTGDWDGAMRLWDTATGALRLKLDVHRGQVQNVDLTPDGAYALSAGRDDTVRLWDLRSRRCAGTMRGGRETNRHPVRLSADGGVGVWVGEDGRIQVWEPRTGTCRWLLGTPLKCQLDACLFEVSAEGQHVLTAEADGARLWRLADGRSRALSGGSPASSMCFSPDGRHAAIASSDRMIRVWDLTDGRLLHAMTGHTGAAHHLALGKGARRLLSGSATDGTVRVWEPPSGRCLRTFPVHRNGVRHVGFPDPGEQFGLAVDAAANSPTHRWRLPDAGYAAEPQVIRPREYAEVSRLGGQAEGLLSEARRAISDGRRKAAFDLLTRARAIDGYERAPQVVDAWHELGRSARRTGLRARGRGRWRPAGSPTAQSPRSAPQPKPGSPSAARATAPSGSGTWTPAPAPG